MNGGCFLLEERDWVGLEEEADVLCQIPTASCFGKRKATGIKICSLSSSAYKTQTHSFPSIAAFCQSSPTLVSCRLDRVGVAIMTKSLCTILHYFTFSSHIIINRRMASAYMAGGMILPYDTTKKASRADPPDADELRCSSRHYRAARGMDPIEGGHNYDTCTVQTPELNSVCEINRRKKHKPTSERKVNNNAITAIVLHKDHHHFDPPEGARGSDPAECKASKPVSGSRAVHRALSVRRKSTGNRRRASGSIGTSEISAKLIKNVRSKEKSMKHQSIVSILKKKDVPPPIAYFGGVQESFSSDEDIDDSTSSRSEEEEIGLNDERNTDDDVKSIKSTSSIKSGMRRGKYAAVNEAASSTQNMSDDDSISDVSDTGGYTSDNTEEESEQFDRTKAHFLRTADLGMTQDTIFAEQFLAPDELAYPHFHQPTPHPPPGVQFHVDENWICVDNGRGGYSPIAPQATDALVAMGYRTATDPMMFTPTNKTRKYMTERRMRFDDMPIPGPLFEGEGNGNDTDCLLWTGSFPHKYYGSELPVIRSQGIVNMSAESLVSLLMDSNRVAEYNKSSKGRYDEVILSDGANPDSCPFSGKRRKKLSGVVVAGSMIIDGCAFLDIEEPDDEQSDCEIEEYDYDDDNGSNRKGSFIIDTTRQCRTSPFVGVTKIVRSVNKLPLLHKTLQFTTLLHCRELTDEQGGNGYIIVGRAITPADDVGRDNKGVIRSEVLLNVHIIRRLGGKRQAGSGRCVMSSDSGRVAKKKDLANRCLLINVNHVKSPMIPRLLARKVGLSAARNFIADVRSSVH